MIELEGGRSRRVNQLVYVTIGLALWGSVALLALLVLLLALAVRQLAE